MLNRLDDLGGVTHQYLSYRDEAAPLAKSLKLLATLTPDVVISSAFPSGAGVHTLDRPWADCVDQALSRLSAAV
ncbi:hypothetical protein BH09ACT7_BH09ACT7_41970 [soil metagenome]